MRKKFWPPKNDRERAIWHAGRDKGWDDAFTAKRMRGQTVHEQIHSFGLKGDTIDVYGNEFHQSMLAVHGKVEGEEDIRIQIFNIFTPTGGHEAEYWLTMQEAKQFGQWLTKRTAPEKPRRQAKPKGPTNG